LGWRWRRRIWRWRPVQLHLVDIQDAPFSWKYQRDVAPCLATSNGHHLLAGLVAGTAAAVAAVVVKATKVAAVVEAVVKTVVKTVVKAAAVVKAVRTTAAVDAIAAQRQTF